jgi:hypothetical protein
VKSVDFLRKSLGFHIDLLDRGGGLIANQKVGGAERREARLVALRRSCHRKPTFSFCFSYYYVTESLATLKIQYYKLIVMLPH